MKANRRVRRVLRAADEAASDIVGTMMAIAVTVMLAAVVAVYAIQPDGAGTVMPDMDLAVSTRTGSSSITLRHVGGDPVDPANVNVNVAVNETTWYHGVVGGPATLWGTGENREIALPAPLPPGARVDVTVYQPNGATLDTASLRLAGADATVPTPGADYYMTLTLGNGRTSANLTPPGSITITASITHPGGRKMVHSVHADLSHIGGGHWVPMGDEGTSGDMFAGDGIFTAQAFVIPGVQTGLKTVNAFVKDVDGITRSGAVTVTITATCVVEAPITAGTMLAHHGTAIGDPGVGNVTNVTLSYLVSTTYTDAILLVAIADDDLNLTKSVDSVTYAGKNLIRIARAQNREVGNNTVSDQGVELWYLVNPPSGNHSLVVGWPAAVDSWVLFAMVYTGVDTDGPIGAKRTALGNTTIISAALDTGLEKSMVFGAFVHDNHGGNFTPGNGGFERFDQAGSTEIRAVGAEMVARGKGNYTFGYRASNVSAIAEDRDWALIVVELRSASAAACSGKNPVSEPVLYEGGLFKRLGVKLTSIEAGNSDNVELWVKVDPVDYPIIRDRKEWTIKGVKLDGEPFKPGSTPVFNAADKTSTWVCAPAPSASGHERRYHVAPSTIAKYDRDRDPFGFYIMVEWQNVVAPSDRFTTTADGPGFDEYIMLDRGESNLEIDFNDWPYDTEC